MALGTLAKGAVTTGFSYPVVAKYVNSSGVVSYTGGMDMARGVSVSVNIETGGDGNTFYANNAAAEEAPRKFKRGTLDLTVDGLLRSAEDLILGTLTTTSVTVATGKSVEISINDDDQNIPYVGYGNVIRRQSAGQVFYQGVVYPKTRFTQFAPGAATEQDDIDWQTQELEATLLRDDSAKHAWQKVTAPVETELEAYNAVRVLLGMTAATVLPGNA